MVTHTLIELHGILSFRFEANSLAVELDYPLPAPDLRTLEFFRRQPFGFQTRPIDAYPSGGLVSTTLLG